MHYLVSKSYIIILATFQYHITYPIPKWNSDDIKVIKNIYDVLKKNLDFKNYDNIILFNKVPIIIYFTCNDKAHCNRIFFAENSYLEISKYSNVFIDILCSRFYYLYFYFLLKFFY